MRGYPKNIVDPILKKITHNLRSNYLTPLPTPNPSGEEVGEGVVTRSLLVCLERVSGDSKGGFGDEQVQSMDDNCGEWV